MFSALMSNNEESWEQFYDCCRVYRKELVGANISTVDVEDCASIFKTQKYMKKFATTLQTNKKLITFDKVRRKLATKNLIRKNVDQRIYWKCDNVYLVKGHFTFGVINAPCKITNGHSPIDLYTTNETFFPNYNLPLSGRNFKRTELLPYECAEISQPFILISKTITLFQIEIENFVLDRVFVPVPEPCWREQISFRAVDDLIPE